MFKIALDNLRLLCFNDDEKVSRVRLAIQNNSSRFATEDYSETQRLKAKCVTRTKKADELDRARKQKVIEYKRRHMNDDRVKDVIIPTYTGEFI
jgi:anaerobic ribonucleoside-triphosphate reductase